MRVLFSSTFIVIISLFFFITPALAANSQTYEVGTSNLHVRSSPSLDGTIIGKLQPGDQVKVFKEYFGWSQTYYGGEIAWVASQYLFEKEENATTQKNPELNNITDNPSELSPKNNLSLEGYNITIDPGHGGKDPGAIGINGIFEKDVVMSVTDNLVNLLQQSGANVILTRDSDYFVSLQDRVHISNAYNTHAFISLHYNAYPLIDVNGIETHYYGGKDSHVLANEIQSVFKQNISLENRGVKQSNFYVLRENNHPSVLIELGFITNPNDLSHIQTQNFENNVANSIVKGVKGYLSKY